MRTTYNGNVDGSFSSLPFGDGYTVTGTDRDPYHFAMMDKDYYDGYDSGMEHAQFRQYSETPGRWMSPDPYSGSYDYSNPQSLNRYSYVLNNPFAFTDPSGLITNNEPCKDNCTNGGDGGMIAAIATLGVSALIDKLESIFGGPSFHGSLKPRPNSQPWDEYHIHYGPDIADAFGLPDPGCDFGVCDGGPSAFGAGQDQGAPDYHSYQPLPPLLPLPGSHIPQVRSPRGGDWHPAKQPSILQRYAGFLGCYYNSVVRTVTNEEDGKGWTAYGFMNAGALWAIKAKKYNLITLTFISSASLMDTGAEINANIACTPLFSR